MDYGILTNSGRYVPTPINTGASCSLGKYGHTHTHAQTGAARFPSTSEAPVVLVEPQPLPCSLHGPVRRAFCSTLDPAPCLLEECALWAQLRLWGLASPLLASVAAGLGPSASLGPVTWESAPLTL